MHVISCRKMGQSLHRAFAVRSFVRLVDCVFRHKQIPKHCSHTHNRSIGHDFYAKTNLHNSQTSLFRLPRVALVYHGTESNKDVSPHWQWLEAGIAGQDSHGKLNHCRPRTPGSSSHLALRDTSEHCANLRQQRRDNKHDRQEGHKGGRHDEKRPPSKAWPHSTPEPASWIEGSSKQHPCKQVCGLRNRLQLPPPHTRGGRGIYGNKRMQYGHNRSGKSGGPGKWRKPKRRTKWNAGKNNDRKGCSR